MGATGSHDVLYIDGRWSAPIDGPTLDVVSPATEEVFARAAGAGQRDVDRAVRAARSAFDNGSWTDLGADRRAAYVRRLGDEIQRRAEEFALIAAREVGTPVGAGHRRHFQATMAKTFTDLYADLASSVPWTEPRVGIHTEILVNRLPAGVVGAIVPWNMPLLLTIAKLAPALVTGCTVVLKPASETPLHSVLLGEIAETIGLPAGVLNIVPAERAVSETLVRHPLVDKISFTGSTAAGRRVAAICGEHLKRCSLELGGKSAALLLPDVDLDAALPALLPSTVANNGQVCVNQTRLLTHRSMYEEVVARVTDAYATMRVGDPLDSETHIGPLASAVQRDRVERYIAIGRDEGARLTTGGARPAIERGFYVEPTVFADVDPSMTIAQEEIFGPVLTVIPYETQDDAVAIANDSAYGLSGSIWSADPEHATQVARSIRTGTVGINVATLDPNAPFGGFKHSGIGREYALEGLLSFTEIQSVLRPL